MGDEKRFTKIKFDGTKVRLEYEVVKGKGAEPDQFAVACSDQPDRAFAQLLAALAVDVVGICELPESDQHKLKVRGVTLTYTNDVRGACITALKSLKTAQGPLVLNTPHLPEEPYGENDAPTLARETVTRLDALIAEADRYLQGHRAQGSLFNEQPPDAVKVTLKDERGDVLFSGTDAELALLAEAVRA